MRKSLPIKVETRYCTIIQKNNFISTKNHKRKEELPMKKIQVYDPPMCCSTGICGPSVDEKLVRFAADLDWLKNQGFIVERFNLSQQPGDFVKEPLVKSALEKEGNDCLPVIVADGAVVHKGSYPSRNELAALAGAPAASLVTDQVRELVAIGAAIASNCEECFKFHYDKARKLGVTKEDMLLAVKTAQMVKDSPAKSISELAVKYLGNKDTEVKNNAACGTGCCC
jgi:AhpD family alkylhydroperoxidase